MQPPGPPHMRRRHEIRMRTRHNGTQLQPLPHPFPHRANDIALFEWVTVKGEGSENKDSTVVLLLKTLS